MGFREFARWNVKVLLQEDYCAEPVTYTVAPVTDLSDFVTVMAQVDRSRDIELDWHADGSVQTRERILLISSNQVDGVKEVRFLDQIGIRKDPTDEESEVEAWKVMRSKNDGVGMHEVTVRRIEPQEKMIGETRKRR